MQYYQSLYKNIEIVSYTVDLENEDYIEPITFESYSGNLNIVYDEDKGELEYVVDYNSKTYSKKEEGSITIFDDNVEKIYFYNIDKEKYLDFFDVISSQVDTSFVDYYTTISEKFLESTYGKLYQIFSITNAEIFDKNTNLYYHLSFTTLDELKYKIKNLDTLEEEKFRLEDVKFLVIPSYLILDLINYVIIDYFRYLEGKTCDLKNLYESGKISIINEPPLDLYDDAGLRIEKNISKVWFIENPKALLQSTYYFPKLTFENYLESISLLEENSIFIDYLDSESISLSYLKSNKISSEDVDKIILEKVDQVLGLPKRDLVERIEMGVGNYNFYQIPNLYYTFSTEVSIENPIEIQIQLPEYIVVRL